MYCVLPVFVALLVFYGTVARSMAAEDTEPQPAFEATVRPEQEEPSVYYETEGDYSLGYRWVANEDALKAAEYIYPHASATFGLNLLSCPLPYRYHVNAEFLSSYDFYTDGGFAYKDLVLFRDILVGTHHNLDHYTYQYAGEAGLVYNDSNRVDKYFTDFTSNLLSLRLKAPDYPFHTFLNHRHVEQDGLVQQRFLLGDFNDINKVSESREIDWKSDALRLGANSHVGAVEVEYAYEQAKFDPGRNNILYDTYPDYPSSSLPVTRVSDIYPHHVVPETESSGHSIKLHSSYTGGIVTGVTLSNLFQKNNYSQAESTTWKGAFDFSWIPDPAVSVFFKYRHRTVNMDTPDTVTLTGLTTPPNNYPVRQGISYDKDVFSLSTRYRATKRFSLFANYEFSHLERRDIADWVLLPGQTNIHTVNLTAHSRPLDKVKVKASYEYRNYEHPEYNNTPDSSNKLRLTTTYTPAPRLNVYLEYILAMTERDSLQYLNSNPAVVVETNERDGRHDQLLASLSAAFSPKATLTASWFYQRWDVEQDLAYGKWVGDGLGAPYIDAGVPYTDESNSFSLSLQYLPREDISLVAGATYTITEGETGYNNVVAGAPFSLSSFSALKASETVLSLDITKKFSKAWEVGLRSYMGIYNDRMYDLLDGNVFINTCTLKRYF
jgi:hypothetical protein